jgi:transcriptional regulator with XRE-family HTH domain
MEVNYNEIGRRISARRKELNLTQEVLAEKVDMSINQISNIENCKSVPSVDTILKLSDVLKTTPDYILLGINKDYDMREILASEICRKILSCTDKQRKMIKDIIALIIQENY